MDLEEQILTEHSKSNINAVVAYIGSNPERFKVLMGLFFSGSYRVVQRSAWVMSSCAGLHPSLIRPYLKRLIHNLENKENHDAVKRNSLKVLEAIQVPPVHHGTLIALCFDFLANKKEPVAVKVYAMSILANLTKAEPDLQKELRILIEDQMPYASPGFKSRGIKVLRLMEKDFANY